MKKVLSLLATICIVSAGLAACAAPAATTAAPAAAAPAAAATTAPTTAAPVAAPTTSSSGSTSSGLPSTITVGVNPTDAPWVMTVNGQLTGFEVDMLNDFAKRAGVTLVYNTAPFATVLTGLQSGKWDIAASSIFINPQRVTAMDFANTYYDAQIGLMVQDNSTIKSVADMKGKTFGGETGSSNQAWLTQNQGTYGPYTIKTYNGEADQMLDLQAGRLDGVVNDASVGLYWLKQNPNSGIHMIYVPGSYNAQAVAFQKGSPLLAGYNKVQDEMVQDGTLKALFEKYFGAEPPADSCLINICAPYLPNEKPTVAPTP